MKYALEIPAIQTQVSLGCQAEERSRLQKVQTRILLEYPSAPEACKTDRLHNTPCYAKMSQLLEETSKSQEFHTIEFLAALIFKNLKAHLKPYKKIKGTYLSVTITKVRPPVASIVSGSQFKICGKI